MCGGWLDCFRFFFLAQRLYIYFLCATAHITNAANCNTYLRLLARPPVWTFCQLIRTQDLNQMGVSHVKC